MLWLPFVEAEISYRRSDAGYQGGRAQSGSAGQTSGEHASSGPPLWRPACQNAADRKAPRCGDCRFRAVDRCGGFGSAAEAPAAGGPASSGKRIVDEKEIEK